MHILEKQTFPVINRKVKEIFLNYRWCNEGFPGDSIDKEPTCQCRRRKRHRFNPWVRKIPWRRKWHPLQCFCLENPMGRRAWRAKSMGFQRVGHDWATKYIHRHPWWRSGQESACQCRGQGFNPWSGKIPCAMGQLSSGTAATEPTL